MNIRHGDVNLSPFTGEIKGQEVKHKGQMILALGEVTGHAHRLTVKNPEDMEIFETVYGRIIRLKSEGILSHEEHKSITVPVGDYVQKMEQEMDWFQNVARQVVD